MVYRAASGPASAHLGLRLDARTSISGLALQLDETLRSDDCFTDPRTDQAACRRVGARSMIVTPLRHHGTPIGVLKVYSPRPAAFDEMSSTTLQLLGGIISATMHRAREVERLSLRALHDGLTGLPNRDQMQSAIEAGIASGRPFGIVFLDLDDFKRVNDERGHAAGDHVLQCVAQRIANSIRDRDLAARIGGDEFVVFLDGVRSADMADETVRRLKRRIEEPFTEGEQPFTISASAGVALFPDHGADALALLKQADAGMYAQKHRRADS